MARFYGPIGYAESVEKSPGVWDDVITEQFYYGDVVRNTRRSEEGDLNNDLSVSNSISIVADARANEHFFDIKYIQWMGKRWTVSTVDASSPPRLLLKLGEVYNGPTPEAA